MLICNRFIANDASLMRYIHHEEGCERLACSSPVVSSRRQVTDGLDIVPVWVANEGPEVVRVVLGKYPGLVENLGARGRRCVAKFDDLVTIGGLEGHMYLSGFAARRHGAEPELRPPVTAEPDHLPEVQHALVAQGRKNRIVELRARFYVGDLDRQVIKHLRLLYLFRQPVISFSRSTTREHCVDRFRALALRAACPRRRQGRGLIARTEGSVSYTHLRAHETDSYLVCRLLLEKKKKKNKQIP